MEKAAVDERAGLKETARIEAFSDGVFAIAVTLLVLELKVPRGVASTEALLADQWPAYLAFGLSFATIGIMWMNHHYLFNLITRSDHWLLLCNLALLLGITAVPFPTALLAEHVGHPGARVAASVYTAWSVVIALLFNLVWRYATHGNRLIDPRADAGLVRTISRAYAVGPFAYLAAFGLSFVSVAASLAITTLLAAFFALPNGPLRKLTGAGQARRRAASTRAAA